MSLVISTFAVIIFVIFAGAVIYRILRETIYYWTISISDYRRTLSNLMHVHLKPKAKQRLYRFRVLYIIYSVAGIITFIVVSWLIGKSIIERLV